MTLLFNAMLYMLVRYVSPSGPMCFRCLMFNMSGRTCGVVVLACLIASWT